MPRKPKQEKKTVTVIVSGKPINVILHPPTGARKSWYTYWPGLVSSISTGQPKLEDAIVVAENMVKNGGKKPTLADAVLSDEEFEEIQRVHFGRKQDPAAKERAEKTLASCLDAIAAFREITCLKPIASATADECAAFQRKALTLPKNWRLKYPNSPEQVKCLSANTVLKWSRSLQAAFERANRNATKRKCVRGVVDEKKLLTTNPWNQFPWIEGKARPIRQFDSSELVAFLDHFEKQWSGITVATTLAKVFLWSSGRRLEVASLIWPQLRVVGAEYHFEIVGKWGVEKWFRVPDGLYRELLVLRTDSPFVFAVYPKQVRHFYEQSCWHGPAKNVVGEFDPENLANWFYKKLKAWSRSLPKGHTSTHIFRKTSLQYARSGEDINRCVAQDARVSETVLMTNYVKETDEQLRAKSNRTYERILASLSPEVARRYGHAEPKANQLEQQIQVAVAARDWPLAAKLTAKLAARNTPGSRIGSG
jgi:integrase